LGVLGAGFWLVLNNIKARIDVYKEHQARKISGGNR
jgi:hypothetical protein